MTQFLEPMVTLGGLPNEFSIVTTEMDALNKLVREENLLASKRHDSTH